MKLEHPIYVLESDRNPQIAMESQSLKPIRKAIYLHGKINETYNVYQIEEKTGVVWRTYELFYAANGAIYMRKTYDKAEIEKRIAAQKQLKIDL